MGSSAPGRGKFGGAAGAQLTVSGPVAKKDETEPQSGVRPKIRPLVRFGTCGLPPGRCCPTSAYNDAGTRT